MKFILRSFSLSIKMILSDPINIFLAIIPTLITLALYIFLLTLTIGQFELLVDWTRPYFISIGDATWISRILIALLTIFLFFVMSWLFFVVVSIISAPFNSILSSRIEEKLVTRLVMDERPDHALSELKNGFLRILSTEFKKIIALALVGLIAFTLNLIPFLYPLSIFLISILFAAQFLDFSWSRHGMSFSNCLKDLTSNVAPYFISGFIFLGLLTIPVFNALVPALATSYYTVLRLFLKGKIVD